MTTIALDLDVPHLLERMAAGDRIAVLHAVDAAVRPYADQFTALELLVLVVAVEDLFSRQCATVLEEAARAS